MNDLLHIFREQLLATGWLEATAVFFGLASVWYSKQEHIWVYPTGIISVLIYVYITFQYKLYADMGINGYYFIMSVYGWYHWMDTTDASKEQIPITKNNRKENLIAILIMLIAFLIIRFGLDYTDSDVPGLDSFTTAVAITGMWLMARKKVENWIYWIITDIVAVPLYLYKGLPLTSFQFFVFTLLAIWGYVSWTKRMEPKVSNSE